MNRNLYKLTLDLFEAGKRHRLQQIASELQYSPDSAVCKIIRKREPQPHQVRYVARELAQKAVDLHREDW